MVSNAALFRAQTAGWGWGVGGLKVQKQSWALPTLGFRSGWSSEVERRGMFQGSQYIHLGVEDPPTLEDSSSG